jgi:hypothetical protein
MLPLPRPKPPTTFLHHDCKQASKLHVVQQLVVVVVGAAMVVMIVQVRSVCGA